MAHSIKDRLETATSLTAEEVAIPLSDNELENITGGLGGPPLSSSAYIYDDLIRGGFGDDITDFGTKDRISLPQADSMADLTVSHDNGNTVIALGENTITIRDRTLDSEILELMIDFG